MCGEDVNSVGLREMVRALVLCAVWAAGYVRDGSIRRAVRMKTSRQLNFWMS